MFLCLMLSFTIPVLSVIEGYETRATNNENVISTERSEWRNPAYERFLAEIILCKQSFQTKQLTRHFY